MKRGTCLTLAGNNQVYQRIGLWGSTIVLMPMDNDDDQVLLYEPSELDELIESGQFTEEPAEGGKR